MSGEQATADRPHGAPAVADGARPGTVEALWAAAADDEAPLAFSDPRERVGPRDPGRVDCRPVGPTPGFVRPVGDGADQVVGARRSPTSDRDPSVTGRPPRADGGARPVPEPTSRGRS
jgi:hypothetical protein